MQLKSVFHGRKVLVTGHTGFKGSWLALWLHRLGAEVCGLSLAPNSDPNHWDLLSLDIANHLFDIRDTTALQRLLKSEQPEVIFHLAAQPLVRQSYRDPLETWSTNVMGSAGLLEAVRTVESVKAVVVVTTDKCYQNREWQWGYRETDRLGGHDPYSASKAATELLVASYRQSFFDQGRGPLVATARAGNVIGGGDWSVDRLVPDIVRAIGADQVIQIRSPNATRPWQHVLDSLAGYLLLSSELLAGNQAAATAWNFGPDQHGNRSVGWVLERMKEAWPDLQWQLDEGDTPHEATLLQLDSAMAKKHLGWLPVWNVERAIDQTADWYRSYYERNEVASGCQLDAFCEDHRHLISADGQ